MSDFSLTTLFVLPSGAIAPANFKRENLQPGQFGIFNSRYKAVVDAAGANASPYVVFGQGRIENVPGLTHKYTDKVNPKSLIEWYKTTASPTARTQITFAGFDGVDTSKTIKAGPDEQFSLTIRARSLYIDTAYAYGLTRTFTITTPCGADCGDNCTIVDPRILAQAFADKINSDVIYSKYVAASVVANCTTAPSAADVVNIVVYTASKSDAGDAFALAQVQDFYADDVVSLVSHDPATGSTVYSISKKSGDPAPANLDGLTWAATGTAVKFQRKSKITVSTADDAATLTDLQSLYPDDTVAEVGSAANGVAEYELTQVSQTAFPDATYSAQATYDDVQGYNGLEWSVEDPTLDGSGCVAGVKIEGKPLDKYGNPCDPIAFPYEFDKLTFEVFAYKGAPTSQDFLTYDRCDNIPVTTTQKSSFVTGSGEEIFMLEKRYHSEQTTGVAKHIYHLPAYNGGFVRYSDPNAFYDTYVLRFKSPDDRSFASGSAQQTETVIVAVPTGSGGALETFLNSYFGAPPVYNAGVL